MYADERIRSEFTLDGVVTVVDAKHVSAQLEESAEACEQIAFADLIILNKTDLAAAEELERIERQIVQLNRVAKICRTRNSELDLGLVFGVESVDFEQRIDAAIAKHDDHDDHNGQDHYDHDHDHHHHHRRHNHLQNIMTVCITEPGELDGMKLSVWFRSQIAGFGANLLRMKGILNLRADSDQFLFQGVRMEFEGRPGRPWSADERRLNRLVFIGRKLDQEAITQGFKSCLYTGGEASGKPDPFGRQELEISPLTLDQIRYWMRQNFGFAKEIPIVVKEVPCVKPSCPPIETAIVAVLKNEPPRHFKIQRPINEITFDNVYDLIENPMPCC